MSHSLIQQTKSPELIDMKILNLKSLQFYENFVIYNRTLFNYLNPFHNSFTEQFNWENESINIKNPV